MMRTALIAAVVMVAAGCGLSEPEVSRPDAATPEVTSPAPAAYVESETCRLRAGKVLNIAELALSDSDIRDVAGRLDTLDGLLPESLAECSSSVVRPTSGAIDSLGAAYDAALFGKGDVGASMKQAATRLRAARIAMDATT